jgi:predicted N-acetyltransferase YhbS
VKVPVSTRLLRETELAEAGRIVRLAFGTFLGLPDPENAFPDVDYVTARWKADPEAAFAAEIEGRVVGSNFATGWGSVGFFGPLTVHPEFWNQGVGESLMEPRLSHGLSGRRHAPPQRPRLQPPRRLRPRRLALGL